LSDILGDYRAYIYFEGERANPLDNNIDITMWYLPARADIGIRGFQYVDRYYTTFHLQGWDEFRYVGGGIIAKYPLDVFKRIEVGVVGERISWTHDTLTEYGHYSRPIGKWWFVAPTVAFVWDISLWGALAPETGFRGRVDFSRGITLDTNSIDFGFLEADIRYYLRLAPEVVLALRGFSGKLFGSYAPNDPYFLDPPKGVRGWSGLGGTSASVFNAELRFPFIEEVRIHFPAPLTIRKIGGVFFLDAGAVWGYTNDPEPGRAHWSIGAGLRVPTPLGILKVDIAYPYNRGRWVWELDLGTMY